MRIANCELVVCIYMYVFSVVLHSQKCFKILFSQIQQWRMKYFKQSKPTQIYTTNGKGNTIWRMRERKNVPTKNNRKRMDLFKERKNIRNFKHFLFRPETSDVTESPGRCINFVLFNIYRYYWLDLAHSTDQQIQSFWFCSQFRFCQSKIRFRTNTFGCFTKRHALAFIVSNQLHL